MQNKNKISSNIHLYVLDLSDGNVNLFNRKNDRRSEIS